jgi:hypothetical protein
VILVTQPRRLIAAVAAALLLSPVGAALSGETAAAATPVTSHQPAAGTPARGSGDPGAEGQAHGSPGVLSGNVVQGW